ncbi:unnamed protein product [Amoebophrya sp. A25]|nr:unnamed protein product [Amoebophrya sp. A25]|eukprot:GSA25T00011531001.1
MSGKGNRRRPSREALPVPPKNLAAKASANIKGTTNSTPSGKAPATTGSPGDGASNGKGANISHASNTNSSTACVRAVSVDKIATTHKVKLHLDVTDDGHYPFGGSTSCGSTNASKGTNEVVVYALHAYISKQLFSTRSKLAPVKKMERMMMNKVDLDYKSEPIPRTACNCDVVRCGVTAPTVEDLITDVKALVPHHYK